MLRDKDIERKLRNLRNLPTLMDVGRLLKSFSKMNIEDSPEVQKEIIFMITHDPVLTFNILRLANSAYYALSRKIIRPREAISIIGFSDISEYILKPMTHSYLPSVPHYDWKAFWFHSLGAAIVAEYIAQLSGFEDAEEAFTASLIHDIGKIVEFLSYPDIFKEVISNTTEKWRPFFEVEREITGIDHAFLGGFLARMWRFPYELTKAIELHHDEVVPLEFHGEKTRTISVITMISNNIVKYYGMITPGASYYDIENKELLNFLGISYNFIDKISFEVRKKAMITLERLGISLSI